MNAHPKRNPLKRDEQSSRCRSSQVLNIKYCIIGAYLMLRTCYRPVYWLSKTRIHVFFDSIISVRFAAKRHILQQKLSEGTNRNLPARNTLVQLFALYIDPESRNAER